MLINTVLKRIIINGETNTIFYSLARVASSLASVFEGKIEDIILPDDIFVKDA